MLLMAIFSLRIRVWVVIIMWFILAPVAHRWDLGPLYVSVALFILLQRHVTLCLFFMHLSINGGLNIFVYHYFCQNDRRHVME